MPNSELIGSSPGFRAVLDQVDTVASFNCTVLIWGRNRYWQGTALQGESDAAGRGGPASMFEEIAGTSKPLTTVLARIKGEHVDMLRGAPAQDSGGFAIDPNQRSSCR